MELTGEGCTFFYVFAYLKDQISMHWDQKLHQINHQPHSMMNGADVAVTQSFRHVFRRTIHSTYHYLVHILLDSLGADTFHFGQILG